MKGTIGWAGVLAALLAGCGGGAAVVVEADPVIAGKRYADAPIALGAVQLQVRLREGAQPRDAAAGPQSVQLSLGFLSSYEAARVVLSGATLRYGSDGKAGEVVTRNEALGTAQGCPVEASSVLPVNYWFNATVNAQTWTCVTLGILTPGRAAGDALELRLEPVNVDGELVRVLPISFARRVTAE